MTRERHEGEHNQYTAEQLAKIGEWSLVRVRQRRAGKTLVRFPFEPRGEATELQLFTFDKGRKR